MKVGITATLTESSIDPATLAVAAEERGFESLFVPEHTHLPQRSRFGDSDLDAIPYVFARLLDPIVALTAAATVTSRLMLGTAICLVAQHDPIVLAKQISSLDRLSRGRFIFGVGPGASRQELANHGVEPDFRLATFREKLSAMKEIWSSDVADYAGEHVKITAVRQEPKPLQGPFPPILLGGWGPTTFRRALKLADGWIPNYALAGDLKRLAAGISDLRSQAEWEGRPERRITVNLAPPTRDTLTSLAEFGVERATLYLGPDGSADTLRRLDELAPLAVALADSEAAADSQ